MGFPVGYTELLLPRIFLCLLSLLGLLRKLIYTVFWLMGLPDFLESDPTSSSSWPEPRSVSTPAHHQESSFFNPVTARLAGDILPVIRFSELNRPGLSGSDCCAVCLHEFENEDEIRRLTNCQHIFHRSCLDRWMMGYNQMTCPLCRTPFIPDDDLQVAFNQRVWSAESNGVSELIEEST